MAISKIRIYSCLHAGMRTCVFVKRLIDDAVRPLADLLNFLILQNR